MKYVISGASSAIGKLTANLLLKHIPASDLTLITRNPATLKSSADKGVRVLAGHHGDPKSLEVGYKGADRLFIISSLAVGYRIEHHRNAIAIAKMSGVKHITYTSVAGLHPANTTPSACEHLATERILQESGISYTALRNQMYMELLYKMITDQALKKGRWYHNSEIGRFSPVARTDIAERAAAIMLDPQRHDRVAYEITGSESISFPELANIAAKIWNTPIEYNAVTDQQMETFLKEHGIPRLGDPSETLMALVFGYDELVKQFSAYEKGLLDITSAHVEFITGKKPKLLESVFKEMIAQCC